MSPVDVVRIGDDSNRECPGAAAFPCCFVNTYRVPEHGTRCVVEQVPGHDEVDRWIANGETSPVKNSGEPRTRGQNVPGLQVRMNPNRRPVPLGYSSGRLPCCCQEWDIQQALTVCDCGTGGRVPGSKRAAPVGPQRPHRHFTPDVYGMKRADEVGNINGQRGSGFEARGRVLALQPARHCPWPRVTTVWRPLCEWNWHRDGQFQAKSARVSQVLRQRGNRGGKARKPDDEPVTKPEHDVVRPAG